LFEPPKRVLGETGSRKNDNIKMNRETVCEFAYWTQLAQDKKKDEELLDQQQKT
jgi:hypothetical protein